MTVETIARKQTFTGGQGSLAFTFKCLEDYPEHINVLVTLTATGVETDLTYGVDYTVSLNSDGVGGTVTVSPTFSTAYTYTVYRVTARTQESDYDDYNNFPADTLESDLDRVVMIVQELGENIDRCIQNSISESSPVTYEEIVSYASTASTMATAASSHATTTITKASEAAVSASEAEAYASGLNLPSISTGAAYKYLQVNSAENGYVQTAVATVAEAQAGSDNTKIMTPSSSTVSLETSQYTFKAGMIILWSGAISSIPTGWVICDGNNGTPNLTDRFVIHADADSGGTNDVGATGGAHSVTLTAAQSGLPLHSHVCNVYENSGASAIGGSSGGNTAAPSTANAGGDAASESHENRPKYYALAYIMKT